MLPTVLAWATLVFDAIGVFVGAVAVIVYLVAFARTRRAPADSVIAIPAGAVRRWLLINALFLAFIAANSIRGVVMHDAPKVVGACAASASIDGLTRGVIGMVLILMPLILIGHIVNLRRASPPHE